MQIRGLAAFVFISGIASLATSLVSTPLVAADLTVSKVVLYKHGIGFFERNGTVPAGDNAQLQFKATEMDDVLKSLTVEQRGGTGISAVRYDSSDPLAKRLELFPFRIGPKVTLADILDQFKGAEIELRLSRGRVNGTIISARRTAATDRQAEKLEVMLLMENGEFQTVDPAAAAGLKFVDLKVQKQFQDYLQVLARSRSLDKRSVTIESGGGASEVAVNYVVPTPIWKSSYRLVFSPDGTPIIEGWAIVDNTSGEDWTNVDMSLVSGLPVSFISRLYEPRYVGRPVVQLAQDRAWRPVIHGGAVDEFRNNRENEGTQARGDQLKRRFAGNKKELSEMASLEMGNRAFRQDVASAAPRAMVGQEMMRAPGRSSMTSTVAAAAVGAELGELFEYKINKPVTIRKGESAMLPFLREKMKARRLLIYDKGNASQHPLNAVELTNETGSTMDGGPITVYDAGSYAGEALMETVKTGDKRLISYAVDLGTRITTAFDSSSKLLSEFHFNRGILTLRHARLETKTFTIHNVDAEAKTVIIEHPARGQYKLVDMKATEKTAASYRFEVTVDANETKKFPITEERLYSEQVAVTNLTPDQIFSYASNKTLDEAGREKLRQIGDLKRQIADNDKGLQRLDQQLNEIVQDQSRLRSNISTLRSVAGQQQRVMEYADKLSRQEGELVTLRDRRAAMRVETDELRKQLNETLETLEI